MADKRIRPPSYELPSLRQNADRATEYKARTNCESSAVDNQEKRDQVKRRRKLLRWQQYDADAEKGAGHRSAAWIEPWRGLLRNVAQHKHHNQNREENQRSDMREGAKDETRGDYRGIRLNE